MDSRQFIESGVLETYVMGLATEQEAKLVGEMAARYPEVKAELEAIEAAMENFDRKNAVAPPAHLKAKILSEIQNSEFRIPESQNGKAKVIALQPKQNSFFKYAAAVALLLVIASGWYSLTLRSELAEQSRKIDEQNRQMEIAAGQLTTMLTFDSIYRHQIDSMKSRIALLSTPGMKSIELKGMEPAPAAKAMVYANTTSGEVYLEIMSLPPVPEGMQYQFWGIVDGKPVDAGMIPVEGDTAGIHPMTTVPNAVAYAISLEPKGGSPQPTGKIYAMGNP